MQREDMLQLVSDNKMNRVVFVYEPLHEKTINLEV